MTFLSTGQSKIAEFSRAFLSSRLAWPALLWVLWVGSCDSGRLQAMRDAFSVLSLNTKKSIIRSVSHRRIHMFYAGFSLIKWLPNNPFHES